MADIEQWVNMERKALFVEDGIKSEKRLGPSVKIGMKFKKEKGAHAKIRLVPQGTPAAYTKGERGRNASFTLQRVGTVAKPAGKKEVVLEAEYAVPCAGGNRYIVEAKYKDKVVKSADVLSVRRRLFYQVLSMQGITPHSVAGMEQDYWSPDKNYYIQLKEKGWRHTIQFIKTIHENYDDFIRAAKAQYKLEKRRPYAFTVVFSNFIADPGTFLHNEDIDVSLPPRASFWKGGATAEIETPQHIWWEMDPAHDKARKWLVSNHTTFEADDGTVTPVADADLSVVGPADYPTGGYRRIRVRLSPSLHRYFSSRKGKLKVRLEVTSVAGWTNGFSFNGINLITVANNVVWQAMPAKTREYTLNHEMGHKVGMVASGVGFLPDAPPTYYKDGAVDYGGHRGPHCSKGAVYSAPTNSWSGAPGCVMFGADGAWAGATAHDSPKEYCPACEKIVRKLDLDAHRLEGFKASVMDY